jgi:hypothetical protein
MIAMNNTTYQKSKIQNKPPWKSYYKIVENIQNITVLLHLPIINNPSKNWIAHCSAEDQDHQRPFNPHRSRY